MRLSALITRTAMVSTLVAPLAAQADQATSPAQPPRCVLADDVRVRTGPNMDKKVTGRLSRGAEVILKTTTEYDGFCFIEGEGQYGYVGCKYLSTEHVARPRAGEGRVDATQRWVSGNLVTVRERD